MCPIRDALPLSAPASSSTPATSAWPHMHANCSGVGSLAGGPSTAAPTRSSASTASASPALAASPSVAIIASAIIVLGQWRGASESAAHRGEGTSGMRAAHWACCSAAQCSASQQLGWWRPVAAEEYWQERAKMLNRSYPTLISLTQSCDPSDII